MLETDTGNDKDDLHIFFKQKFLISYLSLSFINNILQYTQSTTKLSTIEMEDYLEKIRVFASRELGCFLPKPNETEFDYLKL
jgi:hypothetical protein